MLPYSSCRGPSVRKCLKARFSSSQKDNVFGEISLMLIYERLQRRVSPERKLHFNFPFRFGSQCGGEVVQIALLNSAK